jgi:lipase
VSTLRLHTWGPDGGAPVLLVHGVTGHGGRLRRLAEEGLAGMRVIAPDLRGHGDSTWDPPWGAARHVADLLETLDAARLDVVDVAGHSFGGLLALHLAAEAPARVRRLALIDPAVALPAFRAAAEAATVIADPGWDDFAAAREARRRLRPAHAMDTVDEDLAGFLHIAPDGRHRLRYSRPAAICAWSEMAGPPRTPAPLPTLLVTAARADFVTPALRSALRRDLGSALDERTIDAGHMLFWDAHDELAAYLRPFLLGAAVPLQASPTPLRREPDGSNTRDDRPGTGSAGLRAE